MGAKHADLNEFTKLLTVALLRLNSIKVALINRESLRLSYYMHFAPKVIEPRISVCTFHLLASRALVVCMLKF